MRRKNDIRQQMAQHRLSMETEERAKASQIIQKNILTHWIKDWNTVLTYVNLPDEVATIPLISYLIKSGKRLCIPAYNKERDFYYPSELKDFKNETQIGRLGILEPMISALRPVSFSKLDVIFVPGLAFDRKGNRVGYGYGYFDNMCRESQAVKIGLAYDFQVLKQLPSNSKDVLMNIIITEKGVVQCLQ